MNRMPTNRRLELLGISILIVGITIGHYTTPADQPLLHDIFRRLYYVPIVWAAIRFGLTGGLTASGLVSLVFIPHIVHQWGNIPLMSTDAVFEILLYNSIAAVTGILASSERESRDRLGEAHLALVRSDQMKQLGEIAAGMAHEIRNPLASLKSGMEMLGKDDIPGEDRKEVSSIMLPEIERIERTIRTFLSYARPESPSLQPVDVGDVAREVHALLARGGYEGIDFNIAVQPELPKVLADASQIRSVIMNLALNGVSAIEGKGSVDIEVAGDGKDVVIRVKDSGKGIGADVADRIFEPFFTTRKDGLGLGLAIVKRIVQDHGGTIDFESREGKGTTFEVRLRGRVA